MIFWGIKYAPLSDSPPPSLKFVSGAPGVLDTQFSTFLLNQHISLYQPNSLKVSSIKINKVKNLVAGTDY